MLRVSRATDYALLFLSRLAERPECRWNVREAAEALGISRRFLANIVHQLARRDLVVTAKGAGGGVRLVRPPERITIRDVVETFEGRLGLVPCHCGEEPCDQDEVCHLAEYWADLERTMMEKMTETTLRDLGGRS
jgi:Rrf2 family protein